MDICLLKHKCIRDKMVNWSHSSRFASSQGQKWSGQNTQENTWKNKMREMKQSREKEGEECRNKTFQLSCPTLAGATRVSFTCLVIPSHLPCQACAHTPNTNSPPHKNRRITSICTTHAPLIENKALFVLYHSFTLSTLWLLFSVLFLLHTITPPFLCSFFPLSLSVCRKSGIVSHCFTTAEIEEVSNAWSN